jgi:hypothetical protein
LEPCNEDSFLGLNSNSGLYTEEDGTESIVSQLFKMAEETGFEENFGVSKSEFLGIERK